MSVDEQVRVEIQAFLQALDTYAACVAADPDITFEEHRASLVEKALATPPRRLRRRSHKN